MTSALPIDGRTKTEGVGGGGWGGGWGGGVGEKGEKDFSAGRIKLRQGIPSLSKWKESERIKELERPLKAET